MAPAVANPSLTQPEAARSTPLQSESIQSNPEAHYEIARNQKNPIHIGPWLRENAGDPALEVSLCDPVRLPTQTQQLKYLLELYR